MARKTDKECAQALIAAAVIAKGDPVAAKTNTLASGLSRDEMARGAAYIQSGQKVTGR
jgi:hypothetical protein